MSLLEETAVKISNYKCIGDEPQGFDSLQAVNLIIGRNNAGKSTLLDLIERVVTRDYKFQDQLWHKKKEPRIIFSTPLTETAIRRVFSENTSQGGVPGRNHWEYGRAFVGKKITRMLPNNEFVGLESCPEALRPIDNIQDAARYKTELARNAANILEGKSFKRLHAERNILPEIHSNEIQVDGHGNGATNIIQNFINNANLPSELVERDLLQAINKICGKDAQFTRILCQQYPDNKWEIFLEQQDKGRIALSHTGSGFKTIILALIFVHLQTKSRSKISFLLLRNWKTTYIHLY
jgi:putative ATP-dependent endonuclease of the OLD family